MAEQYGLPPLPPFDPHSDVTSAPTRWQRWLQRFQNYVVAVNIECPKRKRAMLLHYAGEAVHDIFQTLSETGEAKDYALAIKKLTDYFAPKQNVDFETYKFRQTRQEVSETLDQYVTKLRQLAIHCDFTDQEREIKAQVIQGCLSSRLRRKALGDSSMTLNDLLTRGRTDEASNRQAAAMELEQDGRMDQRGSVNALGNKNSGRHQPPRVNYDGGRKAESRPQNGTRRRQAQTSDCYHCGRQWPHSEEQPRPARGKTCDKCNKLNHFAAVCRSGKPNHESTRPRRTGNSASRINALQDDDSSSDEEYLYTVTQETLSTLHSKPELEVNIGNVSIPVLIDTGASVNVLNKDHYSQIVGQHKEAKLKKSKIRLYAYGNKEPLPVLGKLDTTVEVKDKVSPVTFFIIDGNHGSLLNCTTATDLGLLKVNIAVNTIGHEHQETKPTAVTKLVEEYADIFQGIGKLKSEGIHIHIDKEVQPTVQSHRRIPFHIRQKVEQELDKLEKAGIIEEPTGPTPWVSPMVCFPKPKNPDEVRCCIDMRLPNLAVKRERHPTPTIDELILDLNGACHFSKLDLRQGYLQIPLAPESRYITTFSTHKGLKQYTRLIFGLSSAAEVFQHEIQKVLQGIQGAKNMSDDILVFGKTQTEHDEALKATFQRLREKGLTLNPNKCIYDKAHLDFYGYTFSAAGISADPHKVKEIQEVDAPQNAAEIRSLLGLTNYVSRFITDYATITEPLRQLTRQDTPFNWTSECQNALNELKARLTSETVMSYYDPTKPTELTVDASPVGLGAILAQKGTSSTGDEEVHIVAYASRALTDVEQRYSQTEKEALAIVWGCEKFHLYLYGDTFNLKTDHKPLEMIFKNPKSRPPARIERWQLRLQQYDFTVTYRSGEGNPADYLSRHPTSGMPHKRSTAEEYVNFVAGNAIPKAMTLQEVQEASDKDPTLHVLKGLIQSGRWHSLQTPDWVPTDANVVELRAYSKIRQELTVTASGLVLRGTRLIMPAILRNRAVEIAHEGHQGVVKSKALVREKIWFPGINATVEDKVSKCFPCQAVGPPKHPEPLKMTEMPKFPWQSLNMDFLGPLPTGEMLLMVIDQHSRFPEVEVLKTTTAGAIIPKLDRIFATHGIPNTITTDNGPPYSGNEIANYMKENGIKHNKTTPLWPQGNAEAESFMKPLMKAIRTSHAEGKNWKRELHKFLLNYRCTPHTTTGVAPAELLYGRVIRGRLPHLEHGIDAQAVRNKALAKDSEAKARMKTYADTRRHARPSTFKVGDSVLAKQTRANKLTTRFDIRPRQVTEVKGSMITANRDSHSITRNSSFFKKVRNNAESDEDDSDDNMPPQEDEQLRPEGDPHEGIGPELPDRPRRLRRPPDRLQDYET